MLRRDSRAAIIPHCGAADTHTVPAAGGGLCAGKGQAVGRPRLGGPEQPGHVCGIPLYDGGGISTAAGAYGTAQLRRSDGCLGRTPCGVYCGGHAADPR